MGLTHFPNGVSSFGIPMVGPGAHWLPKDAAVYFVSGLSGSNDNNGGYDSPYLTPQQAVNQVPNTNQSTNRNRGTMIYVNPAEYNVQTEIMDRRYLRLIGAGMGLSVLNGGASTGTTFNPLPFGAGATTADNFGLVIAARSIHVTGFTIRGTASSYGIYVGDGGRRDSAVNYTAADCWIYGNEFDGTVFSGQFAIAVDGAQNVHIRDNYFYEWLLGGIGIISGAGQTTQGVVIDHNQILRVRGTGVIRPSGGLARAVCVGPGNMFSDDVTTAMTNSVNFGTGDLEGIMGGNYDLTANGATGQTTDRMGGNFETHAMNAPVYPAES